MTVIPVNACDCHVHVVGRHERYPMVPDRAYTPPEASVEQLAAFRSRLGMARSVIVQPSFYGTDNSCLLDALARLGDSARGVAVVPLDIGEAQLRHLHAGGVRGIRVNLETGELRDPVFAAERLVVLAARVAPLGWHVQLFAAAEVIAALARTIADLPVPLVIDHFGMTSVASGRRQAGLAVLLDLVRTGRVYVKLSAPYRISRDPAYADVPPLVRSLIDMAPERMLWGSDWPHTNRLAGLRPTDIHPYRCVSDSAALDLVLDAAGANELRNLILSANPERLYDFPATRPG